MILTLTHLGKLGLGEMGGHHQARDYYIKHDAKTAP